MFSKTYRFSGRNSSVLAINIDRIVLAENHRVKHFLTWNTIGITRSKQT